MEHNNQLLEMLNSKNPIQTYLEIGNEYRLKYGNSKLEKHSNSSNYNKIINSRIIINYYTYTCLFPKNDDQLFFDNNLNGVELIWNITWEKIMNIILKINPVFEEQNIDNYKALKDYFESSIFKIIFMYLNTQITKDVLSSFDNYIIDGEKKSLLNVLNNENIKTDKRIRDRKNRNSNKIPNDLEELFQVFDDFFNLSTKYDKIKSAKSVLNKQLGNHIDSFYLPILIEIVLFTNLNESFYPRIYPLIRMLIPHRNKLSKWERSYWFLSKFEYDNFPHYKNSLPPDWEEYQKMKIRNLIR